MREQSTTRTWIKICGVRDATTARAAAAAGADAVGLVFVDRSRRRVSIEEAKRVVEALPAGVEPVGLFVDASPGRVVQTASEVGLRTVQLHGREGPGWLSQLAEVLAASDLKGLRVVKALAFEAGRAAKSLEPWRQSTRRGETGAAIGRASAAPSAGLHEPADDTGVSRSPPDVTKTVEVVALLWDAPPPRLAGAGSGTLPGGSGKQFDWHALAAWRDEGGLRNLPPIILAGGLTPDNVASAMAIVRPYGVDVSSGVESSPGVKEIDRIRAFCQAVRQAE